MSSRKRLIVFSGGSAANNLIEIFTTLCQDRLGLDFVLPISDNGGSTSEILRVFGGPGIGDVRSRLIRLVDASDNPELIAIKNLLNHRLPGDDAEARLEWFSIVEGTHSLWKGVGEPSSVFLISSDKRELIRSFFNLVNLELLKRQRPQSSFSFHAASIGNLFLTGARIFFGSFESAIYLFRSITGVAEYIEVMPAINSNFAHHIACSLEDGTVIVGQNEISHPSPGPLPSEIAAEDAECIYEGELVEDANLPGSLRELRTRNVVFNKTEENELAAPVDRVWYINPYGQEISPPVNPKVLASLAQAEAVVYSIGSLYTSLVPCLILRNVGLALSSLPAKVPKILLLNGSHDRETGPNHESFTASTFVRAIARSCSYTSKSTEPEKQDWKKYVTHLIYLEGNGAPRVDIEELKKTGIECIRAFGRRADGEGKGMLYDPAALLQSLAAIVGGRRRTETRRNTMDSF